MEKEHFLGIVNTIQASYNLGLLPLFNDDDLDHLVQTNGYTTQITFQAKNVELSLSKVKEYFEKNRSLVVDHRQQLLEQYYFGLLRRSFIDLLENIREYCKITKKNGYLYSRRWFNVARFIRNLFSHNFRVNFNENELKKLPYKWRHLRIDKSFQGRYLSEKDITFYDIKLLFDEMIMFAKTIR